MVLRFQPVRGQHDAQAESPHELAELVVIGQVIGDPEQSAAGQQGLAPQAQGLSRHVVLVPEQPCEQDRRHVPLVDVHRAQARPDRVRRLTFVETRDQADSLVQQRRRHAGEVVRADERVAIRHDEHVMPRVLQHVDQAADLAVVSVLPWVDDDVDGELRELSAQTAGNLDSGIGWFADAEDDLELRVVLQAEGAQMLVEARLGTAQGLEHGNRRELCRQPGGPAPAPDEHRDDGEDCVHRGQCQARDTKDSDERLQRDHVLA